MVIRRRELKMLFGTPFFKRRSRRTGNPTNLVSLPTEILLLIFQFLPHFDRRRNVAGTCKRFHDISRIYWPGVRLDQLPFEILVDIFEYLPFWVLKFRIKPVNRRFRDIIASEVEIERSVRKISIKRNLCFETAVPSGRKRILNPVVQDEDSGLFFVYKTSTRECCYSGPWNKEISKTPSVFLETPPLNLPGVVFESLFYPSVTKLGVVVSQLPGTGYEHIHEKPRSPWYEDYAQLKRRSPPPPILVIDVADCIAAAMFRSNTGLPDYNVFKLKRASFNNDYFNDSRIKLYVQLCYVEGFFLNEYGERVR